MNGAPATADVVILIVLILSALIGLVRGLFKELLSLASWFAAFILALYFAPTVAHYLHGVLADESVRLVIGFVAVFAATLIVGGVVQLLVRQAVKSTGLTGTDRFLGFLFGGIRGVLVCIIALIALRPIADESAWWRASLLVPRLLTFEKDVLDVLGKINDVIHAVETRRQM